MCEVISRRLRAPPGAVDVTSASGCTLSPSLLGPVTVYPCDKTWPHGVTVDCVENAWQYSKCYREHATADNRPTAAWYAWAEHGFSAKNVGRFPMGRGAHHIFSMYRGKQIGLVDARRLIYIPMYEAAARRTSTYDDLYNLYKSYRATGNVLYLRDFNVGPGTPEERVADDSKPLGHAYLLKTMLEADYLAEMG